MNIKVKRLMIKELTRLAKGGNPINREIGLCGNLKRAVSMGLVDTHEVIRRNCVDWKHFSGNNDYPVEGLSVYYVKKCDGTLWVGNQGKLRRSLCRHIIKKLKNSIDE